MPKQLCEIKLDIAFGSDFQEEVWLKMVETTLAALQMQMETAHKGNSLDWDVYTK